MKARDLHAKLGSKKKKSIAELKQLVSTRPDQNPNFCLFLGAGASRNSGIRTAGEMIAEWREAVYKAATDDDTVKTDVELIQWLNTNCGDWYDEKREYSSLIEHEYPLQINRRKFIETEVADKIPSIGYAYLVRLAESGFLRTVFTTNFDDLLNEAFYQFSSERAIVCAHDSSVRTISITSRRSKIIKLHGDYLFDDLKNTSKETHSLEVNMKDKLAEFLKEYGLILVGYSGSDKSITRNLENLLDGSQYLQNGLFWCFREDDTIAPETLEILERDNSFYVIIPGFDELLGELYGMLIGDATSFNSKFAYDRASNVIESYLKNSRLKTSGSKIIRKHLEALESDKNVSLVSDIMQELNADNIASSGLNDKNMLVYLEIERALKERNPEAALIRLSQELLIAVDNRFKEILLHRRYVCSIRLDKMADAKATIKEMLSLDPVNFYVALNECSLLEHRVDRVAYLEKLVSDNPFSAPVLNRYAYELRRAIEVGDKITKNRNVEDAIKSLKTSTKVDPSITNSAWSTLFNIYSKRASLTKNKALLEDIVDTHFSQNAYNANSTEILFRYCEKFKVTEYKGKSLFTYFQEAYERHFPRDYPAQIDVFVDACVEFGNIAGLLKILEEVRFKEEIKDDAIFALTMMDVYQNVMRDVPGAIAYGREFLRKNTKVSVERNLINLHLANGSPDKARELHKKLRGAIGLSQWLEIDAEIMEFEGRFQDAIDTIESLPDRRNFEELNTYKLSYLELRMGVYSRAFKRCKTFLTERSFNLKFEVEIINYEYAKLKDGGKLDLKRISNVSEATDNEMVKGVCYALLQKDKDALAIFQVESEKRFSRITQCLRWPVLAGLEKEIAKIRDGLLKAKRSFVATPT